MCGQEVVKGVGQAGVQSECAGTTCFRRLVQEYSCFERETPSCASSCVKIQFHVQHEEPETAILTVTSRVFDAHQSSTAHTPSHVSSQV